MTYFLYFVRCPISTLVFESCVLFKHRQRDELWIRTSSSQHVVPPALYSSKLQKQVICCKCTMDKEVEHFFTSRNMHVYVLQCIGSSAKSTTNVTVLRINTQEPEWEKNYAKQLQLLSKYHVQIGGTSLFNCLHNANNLNAFLTFLPFQNQLRYCTESRLKFVAWMIKQSDENVEVLCSRTDTSRLSNNSKLSLPLIWHDTFLPAASTIRTRTMRNKHLPI